ncbi:MAG: hypothetical protein II991_03865 [Bacteroidales bacterium]|nr:hypothetical protein [Bacteroidales bacterium]
MKKLLGILTLCLFAFSFTACDKLKKMEDESTESVCDKCGEDPCVCEDETCPDCGKNPCECTTPNPEFTPLQPSEQKEKLASVGQKMMDKMPANEWEKYAQLVEDISNSVYASDDYNWGTLEEWFEGEGEDIYNEEEKLTVNGNKYTSSWISDIVILMSNHTGLFTCTENGVTISDYNGGTKAVFTLNGKKYEAEIKSSGKVTEAIYVYEETDSWEDTGYYDPETDDYIYVGEEIERVDYDKVTVKVGVPEQIDINLTEDGKSLASVTMKFTSSFSKDGINPTTDSFSVKTTASINGFEAVSEKIAYDGATGKASAKVSIKKNGEVLFTTSASADAKIALTTESWEDSYSSYSYSSVELQKAQNINVSLDILGEIQAKGSCTNAMEAVESLELMWNALYDGNTADENEAKRHLDNFNAKININVYYDGKDTKQAAVAFELSKYEYDYDNWVDYDLIPVIVFSDGSRYKVEEFFTENAFGELADNFYEFCESFAEVFGFEI